MRYAALARTRDLTQWQQANAVSRAEENALLIAWVCNGLSMRLQQYRYALEHLVLDAPQQEAVIAERALIAFETDPRSMCRGGPLGPNAPELFPDRGLGQIEPREARFTGVREPPAAPVQITPGPAVISK